MDLALSPHRRSLRHLGAAIVGLSIPLACGGSDTGRDPPAGSGDQGSDAGTSTGEVASDDTSSDTGESSENGTTGGDTSGSDSDSETGSGDDSDDGTIHPTTNHRAGTRLKLNVVSVGDQLISWAGWYDTELDITCYFSHRDEGLRCWPDGQDTPEEAEAYLSATAVVFPGDGRIRRWGALGEDGTENTIAWYDTGLERHVDPQPRRGVGPQNRWVPEFTFSGQQFSDAGCEQRLARHYAAVSFQPPTPDTGYISHEDCERDYYRLGKKFEGQAYQGEEDACEEYEPDEGTLGLYPMGEKITVGEMAEVEVEALEVPGRIWPTYFHSSQSPHFFDGWYDSELEIPCRFVDTDPGDRTCLPVNWDPLRYFADANCSKPAFAHKISCDLGDTAPSHVVRRVDGESRVHSVLDEIASDDVYLDTGGTCERADPEDFDLAYALGEALDPEMFFSGEIVVQ